MGPYTKVRYWPWDSQGKLSVPVWYLDLNESTHAWTPPTASSGPILLLRERSTPVGHQAFLQAGDRQKLADHHRRSRFYLFTYPAIKNLILKYQSCDMSDDEEILIKDPEVVDLSGAVIQSFYKYVPMFKFRANGESQKCYV